MSRTNRLALFRTLSTAPLYCYCMCARACVCLRHMHVVVRALSRLPALDQTLIEVEVATTGHLDPGQ